MTEMKVGIRLRRSLVILSMTSVAIMSAATTQSQPTTIEACKVGLTEAGRRARFQKTFIYRSLTGESGQLIQLELQDERLAQFVELDAFESCVRRWQLIPDTHYFIWLFAGTTAEALAGWRIGLREDPSGMPFVVVLPGVPANPAAAADATRRSAPGVAAEPQGR